MSVIGINGSPRPDGNTFRLVQEVLKGAEEGGLKTKLFQLGEMSFSPCGGCMSCKETASCNKLDDMEQIYQAVAECRQPKGLVLGTPIYFDHLSAHMKALMDRFFCYTYTKLGQQMFPKGFQSVLVATFDATDPHAYDSVLDWFQERLEFYHDIWVVDKIVLWDSSGRPLAQQPDVIARAREAGRLLAGDRSLVK